jgi:hypothetical protein
MTLMGATQFCSSTAELWYATLSVLPQAISPPVVILAFKLEKVLSVRGTCNCNFEHPRSRDTAADTRAMFIWIIFCIHEL